MSAEIIRIEPFTVDNQICYKTISVCTPLYRIGLSRPGCRSSMWEYSESLQWLLRNYRICAVRTRANNAYEKRHERIKMSAYCHY